MINECQTIVFSYACAFFFRKKKSGKWQHDSWPLNLFFGEKFRVVDHSCQRGFFFDLCIALPYDLDLSWPHCDFNVGRFCLKVMSKIMPIVKKKLMQGVNYGNEQQTGSCTSTVNDLKSIIQTKGPGG